MKEKFVICYVVISMRIFLCKLIADFFAISFYFLFWFSLKVNFIFRSSTSTLNYRLVCMSVTLILDCLIFLRNVNMSYLVIFWHYLWQYITTIIKRQNFAIIKEYKIQTNQHWQILLNQRVWKTIIYRYFLALSFVLFYKASKET